MTISVGDKLPEIKLTYMTGDGPAQKTPKELFGGKKVVLFAVPGAFTPTCNNNHLPSYVNNMSELQSKGVDAVGVVSVNDVHVMNQWSKASGGDAGIHFFADGNAEFTKAVGMDLDLGVAGLGVRSKRYAMVLDDCEVKTIMVEDNPGQAEKSTAEAVLEAL